MFDVNALMRALPVSGLEPQRLASILGLVNGPEDRRWLEGIDLIEPPAGQRVPYLNPVIALEKLLRHQGASKEDAMARANAAVIRMKDTVPQDCWVSFYDHFNPKSTPHLPVSDFVAWLRESVDNGNVVKSPQPEFDEPDDLLVLIQPRVLQYIEKAAEVAATTPMFRGPDNWDDAWSLVNLPVLPPPQAMIEFVPGPPWDDQAIDWETQDNPFLRWRDAMRPITHELEKVLGEPVYHFKDLGDELDDDDVHRFLVLHWCCTHNPESAFVRYLLKASRAEDVEELKSALIDPASYSHPFKMNLSFIGMETVPCEFNYIPPRTQKTIGVVFLTEQASESAQSLLAQQIGAHALIVAPKELATDTWVKHATRNCQGWTVRYLYDGKLDEPLDILVSVDQLCVIANLPTSKSGFDLKLSDPVEDLLWMALELGVDARYYQVNRIGLSNPEVSLQKRGVPERVAAKKARCVAFTRQLKELRLDNDFGSSGLWDERGRMLGYDLLALPFSLVRRIATWQRDYDDSMNPPDMGDEAWWMRHRQEALDLGKALQTVLGENTLVKLYRNQGWMNVDQAVQDERSES